MKENCCLGLLEGLACQKSFRFCNLYPIQLFQLREHGDNVGSVAWKIMAWIANHVSINTTISEYLALKNTMKISTLKI